MKTFLANAFAVVRLTAKAFAKNVFISQERKSEVRRRSDTVVVLTIQTQSTNLVEDHPVNISGKFG